MFVRDLDCQNEKWLSSDQLVIAQMLLLLSDRRYILEYVVHTSYILCRLLLYVVYPHPPSIIMVVMVGRLDQGAGSIIEMRL